MNAFSRHGIASLSPSSCNLFAAQPALWVMERLLGRRGPVGAAAHRGTAVEEAVMRVLAGDTEEAGIAAGLERFDALTALSGDPRRQKERDGIADLVRQGVEALKPWGAPTATQEWVSWQPEGLAVPIKGILDVWYEKHGVVLDLKTSLKVPGEIKPSHARQLALYQGALGDNIGAGIAYVGPKKSAVYRLENGERHKQALVLIGRTIERFLDRFEDGEDAARHLVPDLESFYFADPATRQAAYEVFGI